MMEGSLLQDRLRDHAKAFDGLLSLIPAKKYYGEEVNDQWRKKKQTKQEAAAARRGKLDPDSELNRNAKQVMDAQARNKRKLQEMEADEMVGDKSDASFEPPEGIDAEQPGQGLKRKLVESSKKQKRSNSEADLLDDSQQPDQNPVTLSVKDEAKQAGQRTKKAAKRADEEMEDADPAKQSPHQKRPKDVESSLSTGDFHDATTQSRSGPKTGVADGASISDSESQSHSSSDTSELAADVLNPAGDSGSTTASAASTATLTRKPKQLKIPADTTALRARLAAKIEALRAARKADGSDGRPVRTRQELIEVRRAKQEQRKAHKKELRRQAKLEEQRKREEALASNSPGVMSPVVEMDGTGGSLSFGRVAFADGTRASHDLSYVVNNKKKGPSDAKTALLKVQNQKKRLEALDEEKREDISEKERWLAARRRAEGEKIRDNEALLKKAVKRKEAGKRKSEKAWKDRAKSVENAQRGKQKKREENIKKRREDKLLGKAGKKKGASRKKQGGRPGFEGSLGVGGRR